MDEMSNAACSLEPSADTSAVPSMLRPRRKFMNGGLRRPAPYRRRRHASGAGLFWLMPLAAIFFR